MTFARTFVAALAAAAMTPLAFAMPAHAADADQARSDIRAFPRFTVEVIGESGPDVILIPGLATPRDVWRPLAQALKGEARLHLVELRGFAPGDPGPNAQGEVISGLVDGLADYIAANKLAHVRIVGHSLGGLAALDLAATHPAGVDRVMVVDALPFIGMLFAGPGATVEMVEPQAKAMREQLLAQAASGGAMPPATNNALSEAGKAKIVEWTKGVDLRVIGHALYEDMVLDVRPSLPSLAVPVTVLYPVPDGEAERAQVRALYDGAYAPVPVHQMVPVSQSGHFIMLDQPEAFAKAVRDFIPLAP